MAANDGDFSSLPTEIQQQNDVFTLDKYEPIDYHWFYSKNLQEKLIWIPFSFKDSKSLESYYFENAEKIVEARTDQNHDKNKHVISVRGGRFEADLVTLLKRPIYWDGSESKIKRCLWFYKESNEQRFVPYDEDYCEFLEEQYERILTANKYHERITNSKYEDEIFIFHSTQIMLHFVKSSIVDEFGNLNSDAQRPRIIKRGITEVIDKIDADETDQIDHLCFVVHGIGEGCDMRFRPLVDCVDDFRDVSQFITQNYFKSSTENGKIGRIEYIPITWHHDLHADQFGADSRLKPITLQSIPKLRKFANTTILDVLFYTSPVYCQLIISKVGSELNRLYEIFLQRNQTFNGTVSVIGHSLGSLILFDLLTHQFDNQNFMSSKQDGNLDKPAAKNLNITKLLTDLGLKEYIEVFKKEKIDGDNLLLLNDNDLQKLGLPLGARKTLMKAITSEILKNEKDELETLIKTNLASFRHKMRLESAVNAKADDAASASKSKYDCDYEYGIAGSGRLLIKYPKLNFNVESFFALGSPIAMFLTVRGVDTLGVDYKLPTCKGLFNIFHPYDPIAYRIEPLICPDIDVDPVLMPHHLGRKRMHLELKEGLAKVGEDIKHKMFEKLKLTWSSLQDFAKAHKGSIEQPPDSPKAIIDTEEKIVAKELDAVNEIIEDKIENISQVPISPTTPQELNIKIGVLNHGGRRVDYVLQERPIESFNEYLFALGSHACYWESEDTLLLIVKELYSTQSIIPDPPKQPVGIAALEQQSLSIAQAAASTLSSTFSFFKFY